MTVKKHVSYVNDIYRGRVVNIESAIGAAFVDFGEGKNGFLHASDVLPSYGEADWNLEKLLSTPVENKPEQSRGGDEHAHDQEREHEPHHDEPALTDPHAEHDHEHAGQEDGGHADGGEDGHEHGDEHAHEGAHEHHGHDDEPAGRAAHEDMDDDDEDDGPGESRDDGRGHGGRRERGRRGKPARHRVRARIPIDKLLKKGQMVAVQITKDAIGDKGPTLTTYISIPGRYLVLMPSLERTGVSRKIDDEKERRRLKRILQSLDIPDGMGVIVRTAGVGRTKLEIKRDLDYLLLAWEDFSKRLRAGRNPAPLYQESDVAIRTMRDLFTPETESVFVDDAEVYQRVVEFTKRLMPEHLERVRMHEGERPLFHSHGVEQDFEKIFARRVELPSGGSIVIEQTEALVAIDVNSGRTREEGAEFEDIALKTNLEATPEIARQIRLRDLGGIIVLDYIDMMRAGSRRAVERATREALKADRARAKIGRISQFGLLELTRQRLGPGLSKLVYDPCPRCRGSGRRRNASSRAQAIMRRLAAALALKGYTTVEVRTHPDVIEYLETELKVEVAKLQERSGREIKLLAVPEQVEDSVLHYLRADGREVRPGGRRRR
jgi:ribonuclease E